jgi:hypothetical protein
VKSQFHFNGSARNEDASAKNQPAETTEACFFNLPQFFDPFLEPVAQHLCLKRGGFP